MYIAMNRFKVFKDCEQDFEAVWRDRDSHLNEMAGFVEFHLLKGPERDDHTLYSSHTIWTSYELFEAWTKSEQFRKAHAKAGDKTGKKLFDGHPEFEGFTVVQELKSSATKTAAE